MQYQLTSITTARGKAQYYILKIITSSNTGEIVMVLEKWQRVKVIDSTIQ